MLNAKKILITTALLASTLGVVLTPGGANAAVYDSGTQSARIAHARVSGIDNEAQIPGVESSTAKTLGAVGGALLGGWGGGLLGHGAGRIATTILGGAAGGVMGSAAAGEVSKNTSESVQRGIFVTEGSGNNISETVIIQPKDAATDDCRVGDDARVLIPANGKMRVVGCTHPVEHESLPAPR